MDMQIEASKVRTERERRAWSQEQLAAVSGLSLRTIQRVETAGSASFETARALAAVFEVDVSTLRTSIQAFEPATSLQRRSTRKWSYLGFAASLLLALGFFLAPSAHAGEVTLNVTLELNDEKLGDHQLVATEGKSAEIRLDGQMRLFVNPIVTADGSILLSMRVEEPSGQKWVEIGEPRIMVANGTQGQVKVTSPKGKVYRIAITPRRN